MSAYHDLIIRMRAEGANRAKKQVDGLNKSLKNTGTQARRGAYIVQNFSEGLGDLQYGARNIANNIEIMGTQFDELRRSTGSAKEAFKAIGRSFFSLTGAIGIITLLVNYGPEIYSFFKDKIAGAANDAADAIDRANKKLGEVSDPAEYLTGLQSENRDRIKTLKEEINLLERKIEGTALSLASEEHNKKLLKEKNKALEEALALDAQLIEGMQHQSQVRIEAYEAEMKAVTAAKRKEELERKITEEKKKQAELEKAKIAYASKWVSTFGLLGASASDQGVSVTPFGDLLDDFSGKSGFQSITGDLGNFTKGFNDTMDTVVAKTKDATKTVKTDLEQLNETFSAIAAGGIAAFAQALGEGLVEPKDLGKKLLSGIGTLMIAFGTALIAWGVGWKMFKEAPANPTGTIVAGAALVVAGAAIAAIASKAGGKSSAGRTVSRATSPNAIATQTQGTGGTNRVVGELELRGQNLVVALQAANETRGRF